MSDHGRPPPPPGSPGVHLYHLLPAPTNTIIYPDTLLYVLAAPDSPSGSLIMKRPPNIIIIPPAMWCSCVGRRITAVVVAT